MPKKPAKVLTTATPGQQKKLLEQMSVVSHYQQQARESGIVLVALLQMVYQGYDPSKHSYDAQTGAVTVNP
jgi:hypothetical protein